MKRFFLLLTIFLSLPAIQVVSQVGINTSTPDPSAALDILSTTQGLLLPRLTTIERDAISNPSPGLVVYNTDTECLNYRIPTKWVVVCDCPQTTANAGPDQLDIVALETTLAATAAG